MAPIVPFFGGPRRRLVWHSQMGFLPTFFHRLAPLEPKTFQFGFRGPGSQNEYKSPRQSDLHADLLRAELVPKACNGNVQLFNFP